MSKTIIKANSDAAGTSIGLSNLQLDSLAADSITDKAGSGAPDFPQGLTTNGTDVLDYEEAVVVLDGAITGSARFTRVGNIVTMTGVDVWTHASLSVASTNTGLVPAQFRPPITARNLYIVISGQHINQVSILSNGRIDVAYWDTSFSLVADTTTDVPPSLTYSLV